MTLYNCTGHDNDVDNYRISQTLADVKVLTVKNCAELGGRVSIGTFAVQEKNSWLTPFIVTADDFRSLDQAGATGARKSDGTLPHIEYMHLAAGSDLIDAGVNVGLPYAGGAPDLGCFETGCQPAGKSQVSAGNILSQPGNRNRIPRFNTPAGGRCEVRLFDATGNRVTTLASLQVEPGDNILKLDFTIIHNGLYICELIVNSERLFVGRIIRTNKPD
jgi:hypothetical protein